MNATHAHRALVSAALLAIAPHALAHERGSPPSNPEGRAPGPDELRAPRPTPSGRFGTSVSISGDTLVVGETAASVGGPCAGCDQGEPGRAHVFTRSGSGWSHAITLVSDDPAADDGFGLDVELDGTTLAVSAPYEDGPGTSGVVYVFEWDGTAWVREAKVPGAYFGAIALSGDTLAIGVQDSVAIHERDATGWRRVALRRARQLYGLPVVDLALEGELLVAGYYASSAFGEVGVAHVFERTAGAWSHGSLLEPTTGSTWFGALGGLSVSTNGRVVAVGVREPETVVLFEPARPALQEGLSAGGWAELATLQPPPGSSPGMGFGAALAMRGEGLVIGAPQAQVPTGEADGAVYRYRGQAAPRQTAVHLAPVPSASGGFGSALDLQASELVVGAPAHGLLQEGRVYVFEL